MTILFIDDDVDDTALFCEAVEYLNRPELMIHSDQRIKCVIANNGCKAIDLLPGLAEIPEFIFLDLNMPIMGGKECLKYLKKHPKYSQVPVVMFSTFFGPHDEQELITLGAKECIRKPSGFKELVKILSRYTYSKLV